MSVDPLAFLDEMDAGDPSQVGRSEQVPSVGAKDPLDFLAKKHEQKDFRESFEKFLKKGKQPLEKKGGHRGIASDVVTTGTSFAGMPGDIASFLIGDNPLTSANLRKKAFEMLPSLAPETEEEKSWDENLSLVMGFATPSGPFKAAGKLIGKGVGMVAPKFLKGKYRELYEVGKNLGIDEKALAPFRHGTVSDKFLTHIAKLGKTAQEGVAFAEKMASPKYQALFAEGAKIPVNQISKRGVVRGLKDIIADIQKSPALVNESKDVVRFLNEAITGIENHPNLTVENLMALQKSLGKTVNWTSIRQAGKGHLVSEAREMVMKGIYGSNPRLGQQFSDMDKIYAGYQKLAKSVSPSKLVDFASKGGPIGYLALSVLTGHDMGDAIKRTAALYFGKAALGKISGKLLTDPKWVGLKEKFINAIKEQSYDKIPKLLIALKRKYDDEKRPVDEDRYDFSEPE